MASSVNLEASGHASSGFPLFHSVY